MNQVVNGVVTTYTLDLAAGLTQVLADGTYTYLYGNGRIAQATVTQTAYFLGDALGSVRQLVGSTGQVTLARSYEPYGDVLSSSGSGTTSSDFTGEWRDGSGLVFLRARYYASSQGRFLTKDTWSGDLNRPATLVGWHYSLSNPTNYADPSGHDPWWCTSQPNPQECRALALGVDTTDPQAVLKSTIFIHDEDITILSECYDPQTGSLIQRITGTRGTSLGTLVLQNGIYRLYTHNHYGDLSRVDKVEFENAVGEPLGEITGEDFRWRMALAQDAGNAVIVAPLSLLPGSFSQKNLTLIPQYAEFGNPQDVLPGHAVSAAHHTGNTIVSIMARVNSKSTVGDVPVLNLQTVSGRPIIGGDSGGGIWYRGRVIGNIWSTVNINIVNQRTGDIIDTRNLGEFFGAQLPNRFRHP